MCDFKTYAVRYCDLILGFGANQTAFQNHWTQHGQNEKRNCQADPNVWDHAAYADRYPDLKANVGTNENALWTHYVEHGSREMRYPGRGPTAAAWPATACYTHWTSPPTVGGSAGAPPVNVLNQVNQLMQKKQVLDGIKSNVRTHCKCP